MSSDSTLHRKEALASVELASREIVFNAFFFLAVDRMNTVGSL